VPELDVAYQDQAEPPLVAASFDLLSTIIS